jgi:Glycosyl transferase family 2
MKQMRRTTDHGRLTRPEMSVLIVTPDDRRTIARTLRHLRAQTVRDRLELIVCAPTREGLGLAESDVEGFARVTVVEVGRVERVARAKVEGVRAACAPFVAFAEDHCFPEPEWAALLLEAHGRGAAAVGPTMLNANPRTATSWAGLYLHYGCCMEPAPAGAAATLPWHNTSYRRELLLSYGEELAPMLAVEGALLEDLRRRGHELYFEARARTAHVQITRLRSWVLHSFWGGRLFGATRARKQGWKAWRRALYVCGGPLIPLVRLWRTIPRVGATGRGLLPRVIPPMIAGLIPHAAGEVCGYALGFGDSERRYSSYEIKRTLHVTEADRRELEAGD